MISSASLLPLSRMLTWVSAARREAWARQLGRSMLRRNGRRVHRARQHLRQSFPQLSSAALEEYLLGHCVYRNRLFLELGGLRYAPVAELLATVTNWQGIDALQQITQQGQGVIVATPHFGDWERFNLAMGTRVNAAILYKPSGNKAADRWLSSMRARTGVVPLPVTAQGIREVYKRLRRGGVVGILPDQVPKQGAGIRVPFLGRDAYTMTLIHRLIQATQCQVMLGRCYGEVAPVDNSWKYQLKITKAPEAIYQKDAFTSALALNQAVEQIIAEAPAQYLWTCKRWQ